MPISEEQAKKILNVFGPCTSIFECMEVKEVQEEVGELPIPDFLQDRLTIEYTLIERQFASIDPESATWDELANERREMTHGIIERAEKTFGVRLRDPGGVYDSL